MSFLVLSDIKNVATLSNGNQIIDSPERSACAQSSWFSRWGKMGPLNLAFYENVQQFFQKKTHVSGDHFQKLWEQALATHRITWKAEDPLTVKTLQAIDRALAQTLVYSGRGVGFSLKGSKEPAVDELATYLLGKGSLPGNISTPRNMRAIFLRKDPDLVSQMRAAFRSALLHVAQTLPVVGSPEEVTFQAFVGNIVALLPYSDPEIGECFEIPQKVDGHWKLCKYTVDRCIEMSPKGFLTPMRAYGLVSKEGPPLLTFLGTTYPAGDGFMATLLSDVTPGMSVGHVAYLYGKSQIEEWMGRQPRKVHLSGLSLGGALCFHVVRNHRDKIGAVDAYNPAGLYPWHWKEPFNDSPVIRVYYQAGDLVASMGALPFGDSVSIYRVFGIQEDNFLKAHATAYSGGERVLFTKSSAEYENSRPCRTFLMALHMIAGVLFGSIPTLCIGLLYAASGAANYIRVRCVKILRSRL